MSIIVDGYFTSRGSNLSSLINGYISRKQQTLQDLYTQRDTIENLYNQVASGLYATNNQTYQLNSYYNTQILNKTSNISKLMSQINISKNKISGLDTCYNAYKSTATSLDSFLESLREASNTSSTIDFTNSNESVMEVEIKNSTNVTTQRIEYNIKQVATATKATSSVLYGYNISKNTRITDLFAGRYDTAKLIGTRNNLSESMTMEQLGITEGYWNVGDTSLYITKTDTLKDIADRLIADGYNAGIQDGQFFIDNKNVKDMNIHNQESTFGEVLGLTVSTGNFQINGKEITIDNTTTIQNLLDTINNGDYGVGAIFENNQLSLIANQTGNVLIEIDKGTSNFTNVAGFTLGGVMITDNLTLGSDGSQLVMTGSIDISSITENITAGDFTISKENNGTITKETISVTQGTTIQETLNNAIAAINASSLNLTATIENNRFVVTNNEIGADYKLTFESGDSNFTEKVGLTDPISSTGTPSFDSNTNYFTTIYGINTIENPERPNINAGSFKINGTTINLSAGSINDAIATINTYSATTGVIAEYKNGTVLLRNEYTGNENIYIEGGTSNFGEITGLTTASIATGTAIIGQVGSKTTLTGSETVSSDLMIEASKIKINGTEVSLSAGTLQQVVDEFNTNYSDALNVTFSISSNDKLVITETRNGELPFSVSDISGNLAQLTGISGYQTTKGTEEKYGSAKTTFTTTKDVNYTTQILDSKININGHTFNISGTIANAISTINSHSGTTGVEAYIDTNNKFVLRNTNTGSESISFTVTDGDFGRVVGTGTYTTTSGTTTHTNRVSATVTGANTGLDEFTQVLAGSKIQFGTTIIDLGASVGAALLAINNQKEITGIEALLNNDGQFVLQATNDEMSSIEFNVIGSGDFGRVTGLGSYTVGASESNGEIQNSAYSKLVGVNNIGFDTEITASSITLTYVNDMGVNVSKTFELADGSIENALKIINDANWYVKAEIVDNKLQFISRTTGPFQIGLTVNTINGVTGDFGRVVGMASSISADASNSHIGKQAATYVGATSGLNANDELIGTNTITLWMSRTKANTGSATEGGTGDLASTAQTITFTDKDNDGKISLQDAIDSINDVKSTTKIEASLVNGQFVLTQIDANTAGEGDTINFTLAGNGDFARVAGYGTYTTTGEANTGVVTGQSFTTLTGSREINEYNEVLSGAFTFSIKKGNATNSPAVDITTTINIADGTIADAITSINNQLIAAGVAVTASISNGKLQFKSDLAGDYNISVNMDNSDFGRVVGIGSHTTFDGTRSTLGKTAAIITGGETGLTRDSQIVGSVDITLQGLVTRLTTGVNTEGGANNTVSSTKTITLSGTIGDAIDAINAQTNITQIRAYLDAQGRFVLEQTNQNTENEFDTIAFSISGSGDFGLVTGLGTYTTYGQEDVGSTTGQMHSYIAGVVDNLKGTEQITAGVATITLTDNTSSWDPINTVSFNVDISGTVEQVAAQITAKAAELGYELEAFIDTKTGRFTIKSTSNGEDSIGITVARSDLGRVTGIANYTMDYSFVTSAQSTYELHPVLNGGNAVTEDVNVSSGTLKIGTYTISTVNKTMGQIVDEVNNLGLAGVTADLETGYFRIKMFESTTDSPYNVVATGDFARLTGLGSYSVGEATYIDGSYSISDGTPSYQTKSAMGLSNSAKLVNGSITIEHNDGNGGTTTFTIDTTGKTIQQVIDEINATGQTGTSINSTDGYSLNYVYASFENEQIVIKTNEYNHTITATGDFARITGFSEYRSTNSTVTNPTTTIETGTLQYTSQNNSVLSSTTKFTDGILAITFENGTNGTQTISTNATGKTIEQVVTALQTQANNYYADYAKDGYITTRPLISFDETTGKITIQTYGESHDITATGNVAKLTGFDDSYDFTITAMKDIVTYNKNGTLTGGTNVSESNGTALSDQAGTIEFYNGATKIGSINVSETDSLNDVIAKINTMSVDYDEPTDVTNINWDNSINASIVDDKIQISFGAGIQDFKVSGTSSFVYYYGLGSTETILADRSTTYNVANERDIYVYTNGSITGSVDVKDMLTTGSLTVGGTNIGAFSGQQNGVLTFVSQIGGQTYAVGNVEILSTDSLDDVMYKINNMIAVDAITPDGVEINKINGFKASFTSDGKIQITYGGQQGAVRIEDTSGFAEYYGLTDNSATWNQNSYTTQMERPYPDAVGQSVVTGSSLGYTENSVVGGLQSGIFSVSINGKTINVSYTNTESISTIMSRLVDIANQTDGSGLFDYNGELDYNINPIVDDRLAYTINSDGQIVITAGVESRTLDKLEIKDISGNFARATGIATTPEGYTGATGTVTPSATPGIVVDGTNYFVTAYKETGSHGKFSYTGASINDLKGSSVLTGIQDGGFYFSTTDGNKWIEVYAGESVNDILTKINALNSSINATFDEANHRIKITATDNAMQEMIITGDTSGFVQRVGLSQINQSFDTNYTNVEESYGFAKIYGSVDNLHETHILGNIQGGNTGATETISIQSGSGTVNITISDDETLSSVIQKIKDTGKYDAGIESGKFWIQSLTDAAEEIKITDSNFTRIVGLNGATETLSTGHLTVGSMGTMNYTSAAISGLQGSTNLTIDSSLSGTGDGTIRVTLSDKTANTINIATKSFDVAITENMTVDEIMTAIKAASVNAGVSDLSIYFDDSAHKVKISISGNQAEQITFTGADEKGTELIKRLGLATINDTTTKEGVNTKETDGIARIIGSITDLHGTHIMGNLSSETFTINGPNGSVNISITGGQSLNQIISSINEQANGKYLANINSEGRFTIESTSQDSSAISVTSTDFTRRVGLVFSVTANGSSSQTTTGSHGDFIFQGAGGSGGTGIDGMKGTTVFAGLTNGSFKFTLGETSINTPDGKIIYHAKTTYTVNVSSTDTVQAVLDKMKNAIVAGGGITASEMDFGVQIDTTTNKGRIYIKMSGKDASEIIFSNDTSGFVTMAGLSNTGATTDPNYTAVDRSYGKAVMTGSMKNLNASHVFGNMQTGTMVISAGSTSTTINIVATDSIQDIANKIIADGKFKAGLNENGSFYIKSVNETASDITVSGVSDFYKIVGINEGNWTATATHVEGSFGFSKITGSASGLTLNQKFNNMTSGSFEISAAGLRTLTVNVTAGSTTIANLIDYINNTATSDYRAELNAAGQVVIHTKVDNGATINIKDRTSNYAQVLGFTAGTIENDSETVIGKSDIYSTLTGATTGLDSNIKFSSGDFTISVEQPDGTLVTQTFTLTGTESLSTVTATISNSSLGITAALDGTTGQMVLKSKNTGAYSIFATDGTTNFAEVTGLTRNNSQIKPAERGTLATLTSNKTAESADLLGFTTGTFYVSLTDKNGNITDTQKITILSGQTVADVCDQITNSGIGIKAEIDAITNKVVLTRISSTVDGGLCITKGTSDFTNKLGFNAGGLQSATVKETLGTDANNTIIKGKTLATSDMSTKLGILGITEGTIKINNTVINITTDDTISSLINKINNAFAADDDFGVKAEFIDNKIVLSSSIKADNARIELEPGSSNALEVLGFTNGMTLNESLETAGLNAIYTLNGVDYEALSNVIALDGNGNIVAADSVDEAIRLTIQDVGFGYIDFGKKSVEDAYSKLVQFASKFNTAMSVSQNSALTDYSGFRALIATVQAAITNDVGDITKVERELADIGITLYTSYGIDGTVKMSMAISRDKFINTMMENTSKVTDLLIGDDTQPLDPNKAGSFIRLKETLDTEINPISGYFKANSRLLSAQQKALEKELVLEEGELAKLEAELKISANDMETQKSKEELEKLLQNLSEQMGTINELITKLNKQYARSLSVLTINKNNPAFK